MNMFRVFCLCGDIIDFVKEDYFETENIYIKKRTSTTFDISLNFGRRRFRVIENNVLVIQGDYCNQVESYLESIVKLLKIKSETFVLKPVTDAFCKFKKVPDELFLEFKMRDMFPKYSNISDMYFIPALSNEAYYKGYAYQGQSYYFLCDTSFELYYIDIESNKFVHLRSYKPASIFKIIERGYL